MSTIESGGPPGVCLLRRRGLYSKLKPGRGQSAEDVRANQRIRLHGATVDLVAERGFSGLTVRRLIRTSGVSTKTFYDHFENVEECFVSTYRAVLRSAAKTLAGGGGGNPLARLRRGLRALMAQVSADPAPALLALVHAFDGGPALVGEVDRSIEILAREVASAFHPGIGPDSPPPLPYVAVVAGIERTIRARLRAGRHEELLEVGDELCDWALIVLSNRGETPRPAGPQLMRLRSLAGRWEMNFRAADFGPPGCARNRSLAATANLALREGYWSLTAARICEEASVSRRDFGRIYGDVSEPFLEAIETLTVKTAVSAWRAGVDDAWDWREGISCCAEALCTTLSQNPRASRLFLLEALEPGGEGLRRQEALITTATAELARVVPAEHAFAEAAEEASVAAAVATLRSAAASGSPDHLRDAAPIIAHALLAPYAPRRGEASRPPTHFRTSL